MTENAISETATIFIQYVPIRDTRSGESYARTALRQQASDELRGRTDRAAVIGEAQMGLGHGEAYDLGVSDLLKDP